MHPMQAFTYLELIVFVIVTGLLMQVIFLSTNTVLLNTPSQANQWIALQSARQCMEWFSTQRKLNGYTSITCPSTTTPAVCTVPNGFSINTTIACTTWNADTTYKTVTIKVSGLSSASLSMMIGSA
jgi:Tfp pilus assembly protein PilE